jgi:putative transposase
MARPLRIQFSGAHYHITCRGIERRKIYLDNRDRHRFLTMLADSLETYQVLLYAYIMMNNHFHLLVQTKKANCSEFMRHFNIRYTGWFNWRHERSGNLYQGRYHAYLVDADSYLLEVSRYLHLNPVRVKRLKSLSLRERWQKAIDYPWSSLLGYVNEKSVLDFVGYDRLLAMVGGRDGYRTFVRDGLRRGFENPFKHVRSRMILGDGDFAASVKRYLRRASAREQPAYREMISFTQEPEVVLGILRRECGISKEALEQRGANGIIRGIVAELLYKFCEITQAEIGRLLGDIDYMSVYQLRGRLKRKMNKDYEVKKKYCELEMKLQQLVSNV